MISENSSRPTEDTGLRSWYVSNYPTDALGQEISPTATFYDLFDCMDHYRNVYDVIGVEDSAVRERLFQGLADAMGCGYDEVYDQWLLAA